jgi:DNA-directed RNA polymerase specialized sigma24 family protein
LKDFIERYYPSVFAAISRLTRLPDRKELETLTDEVLADLWEQREAFNADDRKGVFIYRTILHHLFAYLKNKGDENRINFLRKALPINPEFYDQLGDGAPSSDQ